MPGMSIDVTDASGAPVVSVRAAIDPSERPHLPSQRQRVPACQTTAGARA